MGFPKFWKRKPKKESTVEVAKPEEKKEEFPEITRAERKKYLGKHVAIIDGKIVGVASSAKAVLSAAKRKFKSKKILIRYVANERLLLDCKCLGKSRSGP